MLYQLSENKFNTIKKFYGLTIANAVSDALRDPEQCRDIGMETYEVTVRSVCGVSTDCLDKAVFLFCKGRDIIEIKPPKMQEWYDPNDVDVAYLDEKVVVFITKTGEPCYANIDAVDTEDGSIHIEDGSWYWMKDMKRIMVLK